MLIYHVKIQEADCFHLLVYNKTIPSSIIYVSLHPSGTDPKKSFKLAVDSGNFSDSEIIVMLGQNGTGKTTFIRMLAGLLK